VASSARNIGLVLGIAVIGSIVSSTLPDPLPTGSALADELGEALRLGYGVCAVLAALAALLGLRTLRARPLRQVQGTG
jgi:hypothetical protein